MNGLEDAAIEAGASRIDAHLVDAVSSLKKVIVVVVLPICFRFADSLLTFSFSLPVILSFTSFLQRKHPFFYFQYLLLFRIPGGSLPNGPKPYLDWQCWLEKSISHIKGRRINISDRPLDHSDAFISDTPGHSENHFIHFSFIQPTFNIIQKKTVSL